MSFVMSPSQAAAELDVLRMRKLRAGLSDRKAELQLRLTALNGEVRGRRIEAWRYRQISDEQTQIKGAILVLDRELTELRVKIDEASTNINVSKSAEKALRTDSADLIQLLSALAQKYQAHASDPTRVSSTRVMAATFAEEIRDVIRAGASK
jgi:chromosome segregation ATPase